MNKAILALPLVLAACTAPEQAVVVDAFDVNYLDTSVAPCEDLFQHTAGGWIDENPIPETETRWGRFNELIETNKYRLKTILEEVSAGTYEKGTDEQLIGDLFASAMDSLARNEAGLTPWGYATVDALPHPEIFTIYLPHLNPFTMTIQELALQGKHNLYNSMAASVAARVLELRSEGIRDSLAQFDGIEHRMEFVVETNGIKFINDSKATNVNSAWYALESITGPVIWIAGGIDKGNDYASLLHLVGSKVDHLICLGTNNKKLIDTFGDRVDSVHEVGSASEAVQLAYQLGLPGHTALLSPACASFDLFGSYEERGREFKAAVRAL